MNTSSSVGSTFRSVSTFPPLVTTFWTTDPIAGSSSSETFNSTVVGVPGRVVRVRPEGGLLEHGRLPDPEGQAIDDLARRVAELEDILRRLIEDHEAAHHK